MSAWREPDVEKALTAKLMGSTNARTTSELVAGFRAKVRTEVLAEVARLFDDRGRAQLDGGIMTAADAAALIRQHAAGKDTGDGTQPPAGESTEAELPAEAYWQAIADALNSCADAGMPVGISMEGILTDHAEWAVIWDRAAERWTVGPYEDDDLPTGEPPAEDPDRWVSCSHTGPSCPNAERARYAVERGWTQEGRAGNWLCTEHTPGGQQPATVEFSDGTVTLTRWNLVQLAPDYYGISHMQIGGWLPEGWKSGSISLGTNSMVRAVLPGADAHAHNVNVQIDVKGYGAPQRFMKIQWRHAYDPAKDHRITGGEAGGSRA